MIFVCYSLPGRTIFPTLIFHKCSSHLTIQMWVSSTGDSDGGGCLLRVGRPVQCHAELSQENQTWGVKCDNNENGNGYAQVVTKTITKVGDEHLHCAMARCDSIDALKVENLLKIDALIWNWNFIWFAQDFYWKFKLARSRRYWKFNWRGQRTT